MKSLAKRVNMYYSSNELRPKFQILSAAFLLIISVVIFPGPVFAGLFTDAAEEYHRSGYAAQMKGDYQEALTNYYKAVNLDSGRASYHNDIGLVYEHLGQINQAEQSYLRAIELNPNYLPPYTNLGYFYKKKQNLAKAADYFQQRIDRGNPSDPWTQKTREELEKLYEGAPHFKEKFLKAQAQRMNLQVAESSRRNFKNQMVVANAEYERGLQLYRAHKTVEAIRAFNASLAFAPQNPKVLKARDAAMKQYRKEEVAIRAERALQMMDEGRDMAAKQQFDEILTIIPNQPN